VTAAASCEQRRRGSATSEPSCPWKACDHGRGPSECDWVLIGRADSVALGCALPRQRGDSSGDASSVCSRRQPCAFVTAAGGRVEYTAAVTAAARRSPHTGRVTASSWFVVGVVETATEQQQRSTCHVAVALCPCMLCALPERTTSHVHVLSLSIADRFIAHAHIDASIDRVCLCVVLPWPCGSMMYGGPKYANHGTPARRV